MSNLNSLIVCLSVLFLLAGCEVDQCPNKISSSKVFQQTFDHCMDKAAMLSKVGTHDNSYDTISECKRYAFSVDTAICEENKK